MNTTATNGAGVTTDAALFGNATAATDCGGNGSANTTATDGAGVTTTAAGIGNMITATGCGGGGGVNTTDTGDGDGATTIAREKSKSEKRRIQKAAKEKEKMERNLLLCQDIMDKVEREGDVVFNFLRTSRATSFVTFGFRI